MVSHVGCRAILSAALLLLATGCDGEPSGPGTASMSIALSETSASVQQGSSTDVEVTVNRSGPSSMPAEISLEGAPTGVTGVTSTLETTSNGSTVATLVIAVGAAVEPGSYGLTIRATNSGSTPVEAAFALTVTAAPGYRLSADPGALTIAQEDERTLEIGVVRTDFADDVTLAAEGTPDGMTASFDPNPVSADAATLTLAPDGTVDPDTYTVTVRGVTADLPDRTVDVEVTVTPPPAPNYTLEVDPSSLTLEQGAAASVDVVITRTNFNEAVTLSTEDVPAGVGIAFSENPVADNGSTMTVTVGVTVGPSTYAFVVRGVTSATTDKTVIVELIVTTPS